MANTPPSYSETSTTTSGTDDRVRESSVNLTAAAEAAARRAREPPAKAPNEKEQYAQEHEARQKFRRLIDPGIVRPNSKEVATLALQTLSKLAENLLREPENPKYQSFKPTNDAIKKRLVEPAGALEYAIAMGFRARVADFQPYYTFEPHFMDQLRIGAAILREAVAVETAKTERIARARAEEKAAAESVKRNVALAYADDRKSQELRNERERIARAARAAASTNAATSSPTSEVPPRYMPGSGHILDSRADNRVEESLNEEDRLIED
jgi:hypothetical protein